MPRNIVTSANGAALIEYGLVVGLVAMIGIAGVSRMGTLVEHSFAQSAVAISAEANDAEDPSQETSQPADDAPADNAPVQAPDNDLDPETVPIEEESAGLACFGGLLDHQAPQYTSDMIQVTIAGSQIARYASSWGTGNNQDRVVHVTGIQPLGHDADIYTMQIRQAHGSPEARNGMFARITDEAGNIILDNSNLQPDMEQNLAAGDDHLMLNNGRFLIDLRGVTTGDYTYTYDDEIGRPDHGDNDGNFDWADTGCSPDRP